MNTQEVSGARSNSNENLSNSKEYEADKPTPNWSWMLLTVNVALYVAVLVFYVLRLDLAPMGNLRKGMGAMMGIFIAPALVSLLLPPWRRGRSTHGRRILAFVVGLSMLANNRGGYLLAHYQRLEK